MITPHNYDKYIYVKYTQYIHTHAYIDTGTMLMCCDAHNYI
jgi:hypothetical protein